METGFDYLLLRQPLWQRCIHGSGIFLILIGSLLLSAAIAYYIYAHNARSSLDDLNFTAAAAPEIGESLPITVISPGTVAPAEPYFEPPPLLGTTAPALVEEEPGELAQARREEELAAPAEVAEVVSTSAVQFQPAEVIEQSAPALSIQVEPPPFQLSSAAIASQQLYPGEALKATYWSDPFAYEPPSYLEASLLKGFQPLSAAMAAAKGTLTAPARILIPTIGVDSDVTGLQIMSLGDSRAYETPKHVVGHIPESSNPGEQGSGWFFGHLESPLAGEGNVFYNLPKIPKLLRKGEEVYTIVEAGSTSYLYRMIETKVVHQNDMQQYDAEGSNIHLVVCVPRLVYDHRLIVTGELVGIRN